MTARRLKAEAWMRGLNPFHRATWADLEWLEFERLKLQGWTDG